MTLLYGLAPGEGAPPLQPRRGLPGPAPEISRRQAQAGAVVRDPSVGKVSLRRDVALELGSLRSFRVEPVWVPGTLYAMLQEAGLGLRACSLPE